MKFFLVFDNSGDTIPFEVTQNQQLFEFFVSKVDAEGQNSFSNDRVLARQVEPKLTHLNWALSKSNEVLYDLINVFFKQNNNLEDYLDQSFLNMIHRDWVMSQLAEVDIDQLRFNSNANRARLGNILHEKYPDEIRKVKIAPVLEKLGYIFPFEEVNMAVHRLEASFTQQMLEFKADQKWNVFDNPYVDSIISNNDVVNFSFGYTYVGRQYYDKFINFDLDLQFEDHYNYEKLEFAFQLNLSKPQTIPYSKEFLNWAGEHGAKLVTNQIPIANIIDIDTRLFDYRKILYRNSRDNNRAKIILH